MCQCEVHRNAMFPVLEKESCSRLMSKGTATAGEYPNRHHLDQVKGMDHQHQNTVTCYKAGPFSYLIPSCSEGRLQWCHCTGSVDGSRTIGFMPPACYTSIGVTARLVCPKGPIEWLPVIPSPSSILQRSRRATDSCLAHQCGVLLVKGMSATSVCIHHKLEHLWFQQKGHKFN